MSFDARQSIDQGFVHLAKRLDPFLALKLAEVLGELPWTTILNELDRAAGRTAQLYTTTDPSAQLKMLTIRLGGLGYPFDDKSRSTSVLGGELRIMRNRLAHNDELSTLDAWRMHDFVVRLLERFEDTEGEKVARNLRQAALEAVIIEEGHAAHPQPVDASAAPTAHVARADFTVAPVERSDVAGDVPAESEFTLIAPPEPPVKLDLDSLKTTPNATKIVGLARAVFEPWTVVPVGSQIVIEDLPKKSAKDQVRAVATDIINFEGPIHIERVAQLTAAAFGVRRLHSTRARQILHQIRQLGLVVDEHKFVWPADIERATWTEFRPNSSATPRDVTLISPIEIANAVRHVRSRRPALSYEELEVAALATFGRKRRTSRVRAHLDKSRVLLG